MDRRTGSLMNQESLGATGYFEQYWRYCSSLRNWFVAYGIGGCVLFVSDKAELFQQMKLERKRIVVIAFLVGVIAQVLLAGLNKCIHWYIYWGKEQKSFCRTWQYKASDWISTQFWIDIVADLITFGAFGWATVNVIMAFFP